MSFGLLVAVVTFLLQSLETNTVFITSEKNKTKINTTTKVHNLITSQLKVPSCQNLFHRPSSWNKVPSSLPKIQIRSLWTTIYVYKSIHLSCFGKKLSSTTEQHTPQKQNRAKPEPAAWEPFWVPLCWATEHSLASGRMTPNTNNQTTLTQYANCQALPSLRSSLSPKFERGATASFARQA